MLEKSTNFKLHQYSGAKRKISVRSAGRGPPGQFGPGAPGRGPPGRGPPGRGPPGRGPPARGPPARGGGPPGGGGGGGGRGPPGPRRGPPARGGPPAMVDVLNPELASQLAVAQNKANSNNDDFNPGHSPNENFNPNRPNNRNNPPQRPQQQSNSYYDYYDYPKPRPKPKPKVNLKSAPPTEDPALAQRRMDRMAKEAEEAEAIRLRAEQEFKNSLILPSLLLVIGLVILAFVVKNKHKIDAAKAKEAAVKNEEVSGNAPATPADASLESGETSDSEPKTPEDAEKIEEIYKQQPLPAINEDPSEKS